MKTSTELQVKVVSAKNSFNEDTVQLNFESSIAFNEVVIKFAPENYRGRYGSSGVSHSYLTNTSETSIQSELIREMQSILADEHF